MSRRDWVYLSCLLAPLFGYNLLLKLIRVFEQPGTPGFLDTLALVRSDIFFNLGYVVLWIGLFVAARRGPLRWLTVFLFHVATVAVAVATTSAHLYYQETGSTLDYGIILYSIGTPADISNIIFSVATPTMWALLLAVILYAVFGPWLVTRSIHRWQDWNPSIRPMEASGIVALSACVIALILVSASLEDAGPKRKSKSFSRDAVVNIVVSQLINQARIESSIKKASAHTVAEAPPDNTSLQSTKNTKKKNVVFIHLESTRAESLTPYNETIGTTPFLNELAGKSLVAENAYTIVPHTSKAITAVDCGIQPHLSSQITEAQPGGVPARCLPQLLKDKGYSTAMFQSATGNFEDRAAEAKNFGYDQFYPLEKLDKQGFRKVNYFGYEDNIMLKPSEKWILDNGNKPFMMTYLGVTGHHDYSPPMTRYGFKNYSSDPMLNRYLNDVNYSDHFVENIMNLYKKLGIYDNTIFVIYGDHGEGFGEHGLYQHDNTIYEEGLRIPIIIHDPGRFGQGKKVQTPSDQLDILPTVTDLLGYKIKGNPYPGRSLLAPTDKRRTLYFSCFDDFRCMASLEKNMKYIYFFGNKPAELYDLSKDPYEQNNLAGKTPKKELDRRRSELLQWYAKINAMYDEYTASPKKNSG
ncbi:MAG: sulfatase-like hydrolase/transferase [Rubrobacteraceae bacterium]